MRLTSWVQGAKRNSVPFGALNVNGTHSAKISPNCLLCASKRWAFSLLNFSPHFASHLRHGKHSCYLLSSLCMCPALLLTLFGDPYNFTCYNSRTKYNFLKNAIPWHKGFTVIGINSTNLLKCRSLFHGMPKSDFMAKPSPGGTSSVSPEHFKISCLSCFARCLSSRACTFTSPPMLSRYDSTDFVLRDNVLLLGELPKRGCDTKVMCSGLAHKEIRLQMRF